MKKVIIFSLLIFSNILLPQSIPWSDVSSAYSLPEGVKLFKGTRTSPALQAYYLDVDLNRSDLAIKPYLTPAGSEIINNFVTRYDAIAGVNGGFFGGTTSYSAVIQPNNVLAKNIASVTRNGKTYYTVRSLFSITETRDLSVDWVYHYGNSAKDVYTFSQPLPNTTTTPAPAPDPSTGKPFYDLLAGVGGGPTLVKNGAVHITFNEEVMFGSGIDMTTSDPRTAIGYKNNKHVIILVVDGRQTISQGVTLSQLAQIFVDLGCVEAMNLDGGGSTQMAVGNSIIDSPSESRPVVSMLAVVKGDSLPLLPPVYYKKIIDTENPECRLIGSGWTAANMLGYYGNSQSMFVLVGNGNAYAQYKPALPKSTSYDVYAWWVSASNRAKDVPYIIKRKNGVDTIRVDQTINGSKWNKIGTFNFSADSTDEIIISNKASQGYVVDADAIRILSFDSTITTSVKETNINKPVEEFNLLQNYPNPFNPSTRISFSLSKQSFISLKVYDILGNEIKSLVNDELTAGEYNVDFNGNHLASGIYFYSVIMNSVDGTQNFSGTKKMILLK